MTRNSEQLRIESMLYAELMEIQLERARLRLRQERGEVDVVKRVLVTSFVIAALVIVWF